MVRYAFCVIETLPVYVRVLCVRALCMRWQVSTFHTLCVAACVAAILTKAFWQPEPLSVLRNQKDSSCHEALAVFAVLCSASNQGLYFCLHTSPFFN